MRRIKKYVKQIEEEICGAMDYAECYIEYKADGDQNNANRYREMAEDELKHAGYIHDNATTAIDRIQRVYTPPAEMMKKWEESHTEYVAKAAEVRRILSV